MKLYRMLESVLVVHAIAVSAAAQSSLGPTPSSPSPPSAADRPATSAQSVYLGTVSSEPLRPGVVELTLEQALDRGLKANLGLFVSRTVNDTQRAERWKSLSELLPHLTGSLRESTQRINLRALGISIPAVPRTVDVSNSDARVELSQSLLDLAAIDHTRSASLAEESAHDDYRDARERVAVIVCSAYLSVLTAQARVKVAQTDLSTAEALYQLASDRQNSGLNPEVDTLRAKVEFQSRQESVIEANNALAKQRIVLLRLLGLDIHQSIRLTDSLALDSVRDISSEAALRQALESRQDYRSAEDQLRSAELEKRSTEMERVPKIVSAANYGSLGTAPGNAVPTWNVGVTLKLPVFEGGRIQAEISDADATLRRKRAEVGDIRTRIAQEVENALLDLGAAKKQVEVSQSALDYANRVLTQSRDRFSAGVTNNIEVIQAQETIANANERWIDSLFAYNIAKIALARATGTAERDSRRLLSHRQTDRP
jgi:outer membrane protein TolC